MLQAMNTGHEGSLTTIHANSPRDALARLETLVMTAGVELPHRAIREQIASAFDLLVQIQRLVDGSRRITHVSEVLGMESDVVTLQDIFLAAAARGGRGIRRRRTACSRRSGRPASSRTSSRSSRRTTSCCRRASSPPTTPTSCARPSPPPGSAVATSDPLGRDTVATPAAFSSSWPRSGSRRPLCRGADPGGRHERLPGSPRHDRRAAGSPAPRLREDGVRVGGTVAVNLGARSRSCSRSTVRSRCAGARFARRPSAAQNVRRRGRVERPRRRRRLRPFGASRSTGFSAPSCRRADALAGITVDTRSRDRALRRDRARGERARGRRAGPAAPSSSSRTATTSRAPFARRRDRRRARAPTPSVYTIGIGGPSFTPDALRDTRARDRWLLPPGTRAHEICPRSTPRSQPSSTRTWQLTY